MTLTVSEADRMRLLKTLQVLKANLSHACDAPVAETHDKIQRSKFKS